MQAPEEFVERLNQVFGGRYRIRWSDARNEWHIEQKVRRGIAEGFADVNPRHVKRAREKHDDLVRARDGYVLTMAVKAGTRDYCKTCNTQLSVPAFETQVITCPYCASRGRHSHQTAGYFPLSDSLIDHLRYIDAENDGIDRVTEAVNRSNELLLHEMNMRYIRRPIEAATRERFNRLVGIPQFGYAGSPYRWDK